MQLAHRLAAATIALGCAAVLGCNTSNNAALCFEMEDSVNARLEECGRAPIQFYGTDSMGMIFGCESVNRIVAPEEITQQCLPWLIDASCSEVGAGFEAWPEYCNPRTHLIFVQVTP